MEYRYEPEGVCSYEMIFEIEGDIVKSLKIIGGCPGNTVGVAQLIKGKKIDENSVSEELYGAVKPKLKDTGLTAVPYPYWNNRGEGEMLVWIKDIRP